MQIRRSPRGKEYLILDLTKNAESFELASSLLSKFESNAYPNILDSIYRRIDQGMMTVAWNSVDTDLSEWHFAVFDITGKGLAKAILKDILE